MKQTVNSTVLISVLVIILLAAFVLGWRHFYPETRSFKGERAAVPMEASTGVP